jgi:hypothetical protein
MALRFITEETDGREALIQVQGLLWNFFAILCLTIFFRQQEVVGRLREGPRCPDTAALCVIWQVLLVCPHAGSRKEFVSLLVNAGQA